VIVGTTKNHQRRSVPIPRFVADELAAQLAGKAPGDLVFTAPEGGVLRNTNFRPRFFDPAAEKAGLAELTPHELRHTTASLAVAAGANVKAVQQMLGHASAAITLDVYAGLFADDLDGVADQLDRVASDGWRRLVLDKRGTSGADVRSMMEARRRAGAVHGTAGALASPIVHGP
jgi:integrase